MSFLPPPEADQPEGTICELLVTAYGLEEAMMEFDDHFNEINSNTPHRFKRFSGDPTVVGKGTSVVFCKHVNDGLAIGTETDLDRFFEELGNRFAIKVFSPDIGTEDEQHLGVMVSKSKDGLKLWTCDGWHGFALRLARHQGDDCPWHESRVRESRRDADRG
jgi:hypothetical protein